MTAKEIRKAFLDFFESKGHHIVPSAPMVIKNDPTLMFTNAGMNQFKDLILGNQAIKYPRVTDTQKCLRVSGKHNDLGEVGHDTYHHTMFEMLGNWSFGDYFKKESIAWAWEFLTERVKIDKDRLYVTVFEGAPQEGLERDNEAAEMWEQYIAKERILEGNKKDNFWEMGDTGPCGPCSEIHIDLRDDAERQQVSGASLVNADHPLVVEIWNLVFMQYDRKADGHLDSLPHKVIDTGMGFERLCMALQNKRSNYDTDVFTPLLKAIESITGKKYGQEEEVDIAMRVIADHVRSISFAITDGQLPSNAKAGYVIRRILRRAVRYGYTFLGMHEPFIHAILPALIDNMGEAFPELEANKTLITNVIREEEESFLRTLEQGIKLLDKKMEVLPKGGQLSGADVFELYDTYGFPYDLTELILDEKGLTTSKEEFDQLMEAQKNRARQAAEVEANDWTIMNDGTSRFVGYDTLKCDSEVIKYRKVKQKNKEFYQIVMTETPFYAEMGGQIGDSGIMRSQAENGKEYRIIDTKQENNLTMHIMTELPQAIDSTFELIVTDNRRRLTEANHTATHLLHHALRTILGSHVEQKGSYVSNDLLRFDFSHFKKLTTEEIREVETMVNSMIRANIQREEHRNIAIKEAEAMGAMALFGEKYGDEVRVLKYGDSVELCGGCHVPATGVIGAFKIITETSIASGIRRIEAITGPAVSEYIYKQEDLLTQLSEALNNAPNLLTAVTKLSEEYNTLKKKVEEMDKAVAKNIKEQVLASARDCNGTQVMTLHQELSANLAKDVASMVRDAMTGSFAYIGATYEGAKCSLIIVLSKDLTEQGLNGSKMITSVTQFIKGGGGGQPHYAMAGGKNPEGLPDAIATILKDNGWA